MLTELIKARLYAFLIDLKNHQNLLGFALFKMLFELRFPVPTVNLLDLIYLAPNPIELAA